MITKSSLVKAIKEKVKKPIATLAADSWGWKQSLSLSSGDVPDLKDKKVGDKVSMQVEGVVKSTYDDGKMNIEINKIG